MFLNVPEDPAVTILRVLDDRYLTPRERLQRAAPLYWRASTGGAIAYEESGAARRMLEEWLLRIGLDPREIIQMPEGCIDDLLLDLYQFATDRCRQAILAWAPIMP
jgi:hypothetical protein